MTTSTLKGETIGRPPIKKAPARKKAVSKSTRTNKLLGFSLKIKPVNMVTVVREGVPFRSVENLADELGMTTNEFGEHYLRMSPSTTTRRRKSGFLNEGESDRAVRFARLIEQTTELHEGDEDAARRWLTSPLPIFDEESPLDYARSEAGCREVEQLILRLEYGMFS